MSAIEIRGLDVFYGPIQALRGIDMDVAEGEITALLGANGAGKTTLLRTISGLCAPRAGSIRFGGQDIVGLEPFEIVRRGISHSPEGRQVFAAMTVKENLQLGAFTRKDAAGVARDLEWVLDLWPRLRERLGQAAGTLSGGEQQMLAMARALMARPKVLLLDEPSLGLAPVIVAGIFETIRQIHAQGVCVLLVEQNVHLALKVAQHAYILETGAIVRRASAAELLHDPSVRDAYLGGAPAGHG